LPKKNKFFIKINCLIPGKLVIFIADASLEHRNFFKESLKKAGIDAKVLSFNSEKRLMNALGQPTASPDIIFLTFELDTESALACLKWIRLKKKFSNVPVVIFSPFTYLKDIKDAFDNGASLFVPKLIFTENCSKTLNNIFHYNWQHDLLSPQKERFVLALDNENCEKLCRSGS
jgi:DNA-binding response OmpR family regulator